MDYCNSVKLLLSLTVQVLLWRTVTVSPMDVEIGEIRYQLFQSIYRNDGDFCRSQFTRYLLNT